MSEQHKTHVKKERYHGRLAQIRIYLGKLLRMFIYQSDWKALPMAALIAGLVTFAVGPNLYKTQEGTLQGSFALVCVCVWNGFFNSIQVVCRERTIIKREHRAGMHISAYVAAHMIYQALLCAAQTVIIIGICRLSGISFPTAGLLTRRFLVDFGLLLFLTTYSADMLSLMISSLVKNTTTAMTVMPFLLIFQLLFSGGLVRLGEEMNWITKLTLTKWGLIGLCALGNYNSLPMVTLWNTLWRFREVDVGGIKPVAEALDMITDNGLQDLVLQKSGEYSQLAEYAYTSENLANCLIRLGIFAVLFALIALILLEFVDKDKR